MKKRSVPLPSSFSHCYLLSIHFTGSYFWEVCLCHPHFYLLSIHFTGSYFCYDNPAALQDMMLKDLNLSEGQFMLFYSLYSWPNVILCFFGGFLIDSLFGVRLGAIIFGGFVLVGQVSMKGCTENHISQNKQVFVFAVICS